MAAQPRQTRKFQRNNKVVALFVALIVILAVAGVAPMIVSAIMGPGTRTEMLNADGAKPASTDVTGHWTVGKGSRPNTSAVGFTFEEILPSGHKLTSGTTHDVSGFVDIEGTTLQRGEVTVQMGNISTDEQKRDINVRRKLLFTDQYPESHFTLTKPVDVSQVPGNGTPGTLTLTGTLTIMGQSHEITQEFQALRDDDRLVVSADVPIAREDYGVKTPDFIAAKVAPKGLLNIRLSFDKSEG
ncbi:YceI family protein [Corynebacterium uropygiale]|uniref:YceI family protein n=1 Tax=Corynebacterium uropygiale TaxID=1775911 RepID=A0A9X1QP03_9CORY|nr:YceI family protein [Corynebacterium uropygiale]MCF4006669.1 YceI family protein [Corynebacterium uropygiale]